MSSSDFDPPIVEEFREWVQARLGLAFDEPRLETLEKALRRRAAATALSRSAYLARLKLSASRQEIGELARDLTIGETYFFRNPDQFRVLGEVVGRTRAPPDNERRSLRILSAGCSSGEEALTLAMVLRESIPDISSWNIEIRAVDVNPRAEIKEARFSPWSLRETSHEVRDRWFEARGGAYVIDEQITRMVTFEERNLIDDDPALFRPLHYDAIFCRNVVMYFSSDQAQALIGRFARSLVPAGLLFLGHAETLRGISNDFHLLHSHDAFYYQRRDCEAGQASAASPTARPHQRKELEAGESWVETIRQASERLEVLANRFSSKAGAQLSEPSLAALQDAQVSLRAERYQEALATLDGLSPESAQTAEALLLRALVLTHSGRLPAAEQTCRSLLSVDELNAGAYYLLALCREALGDPSGAVENDRTACYLDPEFAMARLHMGLLARRAGDMELAKRELLEALKLLPREDPSRLLLYGGGFKRESLMALSRAELERCEAAP